MQQDWIVITGAREHNLKNVNVRIPRNRLTVITGLSGSGKSSLAFDTLYAEGQRRYVESLSAYARQFLDQLQKPDVDQIEGLSPSIAIEQRTAGSNPRSTVATATEIHDFLRLLYAAVGVPHCPKCGRDVARQSAEDIVDFFLALPPRTAIGVLAPVTRRMKGNRDETLDDIRRQGFLRVRVDGVIHDVEDVPPLSARKTCVIEAVVDRLTVGGDIRSRLTDSVETALHLAGGVLKAVWTGPDGAAGERMFSERFACPECDIHFDPLTSRSFSFNSPEGACPRCSGLGTRLVFDPELVVPDPARSIEDGAIQAWRKGGRRLIIHYKRVLKALAKHYGFDLATPFKDLPSTVRKVLFEGSGEEEVEFGLWRGGAWKRHSKPFEGILANLERRYIETESEYIKQQLRHYMNPRRCEVCDGARLKPESAACTVAGQSVVQVSAMTVREALAFFRGLRLEGVQREMAGDVLSEIVRRLEFLDKVGLDYLTLDRESGTLSGGEAQRIRLATQIGAGLVGVVYVLDEPTIGLHSRDNARLIGVLQRLRDQGNTVVVVEHDPAMVRAADYVVDLGPGAGRHGGEVIFQGETAALAGCAASLTAQYLSGERRIPVPAKRHSPGADALTVVGASSNNLRNIDVSFPLGCFVCVTGVSGSGKSTLVDDILYKALARKLHGAKDRPGAHEKLLGAEKVDKVVVVDASPIGRTPRSNPATYTDIFNDIRKLFARTPLARMRGYGPGRFSFNVKGGRCETCRGEGLLQFSMHFLPDVYVTCQRCRGLRYNRETLEVRYGGKTIADVLGMTVEDALGFFAAVPAVHRRLRTLAEVGLGYVQLGQSATTLSGGEAQRVKLAAELSRTDTGRTLYLLDEPTTGLHMEDVRRLLDVLHRLRDAGNTVIVIEHNLDVIRTADYIIDLGPEGGTEGGRVVVAGTTDEVAACEASWTGRFLKSELNRTE
jgi:excinuclease ABC subunit A